MNNMGGIRAH